MLKRVISLSLFLFTAHAGYAAECTINSFDKIIYIDGGLPSNIKSIVKNTDCSKEITNKFIKGILGSNGTITERALNTVYLEGVNEKVNLVPSKIQVSNIKTLLERQFKLEKDWSFEKIKFVNKKRVLGLSHNERAEFECDLCHTTGEKTISLKVINPIKNTSKTLWLQGMVFISTNVLVPNRPISPSETSLSPSNFKIKRVNVMRPEKFFTNKSKLVFYKVNKPLTGERGLMFTDLTPINLVSAGIPAKVILKSGTLTLHGKGVPSQSGKFGEVIKLKNPKTNRIITGKVVDFNKVVVDL